MHHDSLPSHADQAAVWGGQHLSDDLERTVRAEIAEAERPDHPMRRMLRRARAWVARYPRLEHAYRVAVGILGGTLSVIGLLLVPLPGPGWLVVFLGLAVLGTEFALGQAHRRLAQAAARPFLGVVEGPPRAACRAGDDRIARTLALERAGREY